MLVLSPNQTGLKRNIYINDIKEGVSIPKKLNYGNNLPQSIECDFSDLRSLNIPMTYSNIYNISEDEASDLIRWVEINWVALLHVYNGNYDHGYFLENHVPFYNNVATLLTLYPSRTGLPKAIRLGRPLHIGAILAESQYYIIYDLDEEIPFYFWYINKLDDYIRDFEIEKRKIQRKEINLVKMWLYENHHVLCLFYNGIIDTFGFIKAHKPILNSRNDTNIFQNS